MNNLTFKTPKAKSIIGLVEQINTDPQKLLSDIGIHEYTDITNENGMLDYEDLDHLFNLLEKNKASKKMKCALDPYDYELETKFMFALRQVIDELYIDIPDPDANDFDLIEFYTELFTHKFDLSKVEALFYEDFNEDLHAYFCKYYSKENLEYFILGTYSYILERNPFMLFSTPYSTGNYYGEVMTITCQGEYPADFKEMIVAKFIDHMQHGNKFSVAYLNYYKEKKEFRQPVVKNHAQNSNVLKEKCLNFYDTLNHGSFIPFIGNRISTETMLLDVAKDNTQKIFSFGAYVQNHDLRLIGVCANKPKKPPLEKDVFSLKTELECNNIFYRNSIPHFQRLFANFPHYLEENKLLKRLSEEPDIFWSLMQHYFWLVTQEHRSADSFLQYMPRILRNDNRTLEAAIRGFENLKQNSVSKEISKSICEYMLLTKIPIFHDNISTYNELLNIVNYNKSKFDFYKLQIYCAQKKNAETEFMSPN